MVMTEELLPEEKTGFEVAEDWDTFLLQKHSYPMQLPWSSRQASLEENLKEETETEWEEIRRIVQEELRRPRTYPRRDESVETKAKSQAEIPSTGAVMEIDLDCFPLHPTVPIEEVEGERKPLPIEEVQGEKADRADRKEEGGKRIVTRLILFILLMAVGGGIFWYWSKKGETQVARGEKKHRESVQEEGRKASASSPFRSVREIEPLWLSQLPLLQDTPNTQTTTTQTKQPHTTTHPAEPKAPLLSYSTTPTPTPTGQSAPLFVVQVYASLSQADASEVVEQLRRRGFSNVYVTPAQIRGQTWWRVRFGPYNSRLQAEEAALSAGFSNAWIIRVQ